MKILKNIVLLIICSVVLLPAFSQEEKTVIRVGISNQSFSTYEYIESDFCATGEISITDLSTNQSVSKLPKETQIHAQINDNFLNIYADNKLILEKIIGPVVISSNGVIGITKLNRKGLPAYYMGLIELKMTKNNKFNIINVLDLQTYLKGVVPNEMPISFGLEALKAQAVAARNYANRPMRNPKNYDICDSTACQVYYGANSQKEISNRAVDETLGIYALYNKEPILALYSSTAGGITESYENVYSPNILFPVVKPYLRSVKDDPGQKSLKTEEDVREYYSKAPVSYDIKSPRYRWKVEWTRDELEQILNKTLKEQSRAGLVEPSFSENSKLEDLEDIKIIRRGESGKALELEIYAKGSVWKVKKELGIRRVFKKNNSMLASGNFFVDKTYEKENNEQSQEDSREPIFPFGKIINLNAKKLPEKFIFTGGGYGHGVGMSQYGAGFMASKGKQYDTILKHYYIGIDLGTMPKTVKYNNYGMNYKIEYYFDKSKKCYLKMDNSKRASEIEFYINSYKFKPDLYEYGAKTLKLDITEYLKQGKNTIVFRPLSDKDKTKTLSVWTEILN